MLKVLLSRKTLAALFILTIGAAIIWTLAYGYWLDKRIENKLTQMREDGFLVTLSDLEKSYRQPNDKNAADVYLQAFYYFDDEDDEDDEDDDSLYQRYFKKEDKYEKNTRYQALPLVKKGDLSDYGSAPLPPEIKRLINEYLAEAESQKVIPLLRQAVEIPECRYEIDFSQGYEAPLEHLPDLQKSMELCLLRAILYADENQPQQAVEEVLITLKMANSILYEPFVNSRFVRVWAQKKCARVCRFIIRRTQLLKPQIAKLFTAFREIEAFDNTKQGLEFECAKAVGIYRGMLDGSFEKFQERAAMADPSFFTFCWYRVTRKLERDFLAYLNTMHAALKISRLPITERMAAMKIIARHRKAARNSNHQLINRALTTGTYPIVQDIHNLVRFRCLFLVLAIEYHRLHRGELPQKLSDIFCPYITSIPVDPYGGKLLRYKRTNGYMVYSIGPDGEDNNGRSGEEARRLSIRGFDIVFAVER